MGSDARTVAMRGDPGQLVGRRAELETLDQLLSDARRASAAVVLIGEPGIGKTRLLSELCERASASGFEILRGSGAEMESQVPFGLVVDALDEPLGALKMAMLRRLGNERLSELGAVLPSLAGVGGGLSSTLQVERYRCHHAIRVALEQLAEQRPVVLALDDMHWADPASVELVSHLLRRGVPRSLLVLAYRPGQAPRQLVRAMDSTSRAGGLRRLQLEPLSLEEATELLGAGRHTSSMDALYRDSGGVPFYLEQLARGGTERAATSWSAGTVEPLPVGQVPANVRGAIAEELEQLPATALRLVQAAAVAGEPFELELAAEIGDVELTAALGALDQLIAADLVRPTAIPRQFVFRHPIVRRATYDATPSGRRLGAHRRAAGALARRGATIGVRAHHVEHSAVPGDEEAIAVLTEAGQAAAARAPSAAAHWFEAALQLQPSNVEQARRLSLLVALASALGAVGRLEDCRAVLSQALELCPPEAQVQVVAMIARIEQDLGRTEEARRLLAAALTEAEQWSRQAAALTVEMAQSHVIIGDWDDAARVATAARDQASRLGDRALYLFATSMLAWTASFRGAIAEAQKYADEASKDIDEVPEQQLAPYMDALATLTNAEMSLERFAAAAVHAERGVGLCRSTGQGYMFLRFILALAATKMLQGRLEEARAAAEAAMEAALLIDNDRLNDQLTVASAGLRCWIASVQNDTGVALEAGQVAVCAAERAPRAMYAWLAHVSYGEALIDAGQPDEGRAHILAAGGPALRHLEPAYRPHWHRVLAEADAAAGRLDAAEAMAERAEAAASTLEHHSVKGHALHARACVLLARCHHDEAATVARDAAEHFAAADSLVAAARAQMLAGRALAMAGETDAAARELEAAHAALESCGATRYRNQAAKELRNLGRRVPHHVKRRARTDLGYGSLSSREREIAELVAEGYTNRQIAADLYLSEKTIEASLTRAFAKLGVRSRSAVAAAIARRDVR